MRVDQARAYMDGHKPEDYVLLDVRQPWEYEEFHLPGARLVPLPELPDRLGEIPQECPVLAYCASGARSMAAASLLDGQGFADVSSMVGGIMAWRGNVAFGSIDLGMHGLTGRETPAEVVLKAFAMEHGLQSFYVLRADLAETEERIELFMELAGYEDRHKDMLHALYGRMVGELPDYDAFEKMALASAGGLSEGGVDISAFLEEHADAFDGDQGVLQFAAMVEAQALDYYLRCAVRAEAEDTRSVLQLLAREEKAHLKILGKHMDRLGE
ncbi:MAG: rhodanese-like domain-containing protein [Pseudodesulfovibrio sp.]